MILRLSLSFSWGSTRNIVLLCIIITGNTTIFIEAKCNYIYYSLLYFCCDFIFYYWSSPCQIWHGHLRQRRGTVSGTVGGTGLGEPGTHATLSFAIAATLQGAPIVPHPIESPSPCQLCRPKPPQRLFFSLVLSHWGWTTKARQVTWRSCWSPRPLHPITFLIMSVNPCIPSGSSVAGRRAQRG